MTYIDPNDFPLEAMQDLRRWISSADTMSERITRLNITRSELSSVSPFQHEPVDRLIWVPAESVKANDYNPNTVAPPEMELLRHSIQEDGFCVAAGTPVLCDDLTWRRAGDLVVGQKLIAFDEHSDANGNSKNRRFRTAEVTHNEIRMDELYRVNTSRGPIYTNAEHPWLARRLSGQARCRAWRWIPTHDLKPEDQLAYLLDPWVADQSYDAGWLSGFLDGEGTIAQNQTLKKGHARGYRLAAYQCPGETADKMVKEITNRVQATVYTHSRRATNPKWNDCVFVRVDRMREVMKLLGTVRPERLLKNSYGFWEGTILASSAVSTPVIVKSVEHDSKGHIASLATSTRTYIAGGFAMHNTQPIVTSVSADGREVVDGFHRNRVGREYPEIQARIHGHLPVVSIRADRQDRNDRMASTIRHNRARGQHQVPKMSDIVLSLARRNWSDQKIAKELGMDMDEVLRLKQVSGLAEAFKDRDFSRAWEPE